MLFGNQAHERHERRCGRELREVPDFCGNGGGRQSFDASEGPKRAHCVGERRKGRQLLDPLIQGLHLGIAALCGGDVVIERLLGAGLLEAHRAHPVLIRMAPSLRLLGIATSTAKQERLQSLDRASAVGLDVLTHPDQITHRFFFGRRHAHRGELARAVKPSKVARVDAIGLDLVPVAARDQCRCDDVTRCTQRVEHPVRIEAAGPCFVAKHGIISAKARDELAIRFGRGRDHPMVGFNNAWAQDRDCG
jgi:hypothetical protein